MKGLERKLGDMKSKGVKPSRNELVVLLKGELQDIDDYYIGKAIDDNPYLVRYMLGDDEHTIQKTAEMANIGADGLLMFGKTRPFGYLIKKLTHVGTPLDMISAIRYGVLTKRYGDAALKGLVTLVGGFPGSSILTNRFDTSRLATKALLDAAKDNQKYGTKLEYIPEVHNSRIRGSPLGEEVLI